jgi:hypothetical protein
MAKLVDQPNARSKSVVRTLFLIIILLTIRLSSVTD